MIDDDDYISAPDGGPWKRRLLGYCAPLVIVAYAVYGYLIQKVIFPRGGVFFVGYAAKFLALSYVAGAFYLYFHYGWRLSERLCMHSFRPKYFAIFSFLLFIVTACYFQFVS